MYDNTFAIESLVALQHAQDVRDARRWRRRMDAIDARSETGMSRPPRPTTVRDSPERLTWFHRIRARPT